MQGVSVFRGPLGPFLRSRAGIRFNLNRSFLHLMA
nr:MAG TPA: hypothetical protein [Caudoviricetes sp.]